MKTESLLDAIGMIDDRYIEEACRAGRQTRQIPIRRLSVIAACLMLVCSISFLAVQNSVFRQEPQPGRDLPMLSLDRNGFLSGGMGFEGYMANDVSELVNGNPWTASESITTLPVFQNTRTYDENGVVPKPDIEAMKIRLSEIAARFGIDIADVDVLIKDDYPDEETIKKVTEQYAERGESVPMKFFGVGRVSLEKDNLRLEVDSDLTATIRFEPAVMLPSEYDFSYDASYEDISKVAEYLQQEFSGLISMKNPKVDIYGGDYDIDGMQKYQIAFYDGGGSLAERIVNYNFNRVTFSENDNGELFIARVFLPDLSQKLGDYPAITPGQAEELLAEGRYITTVPTDFPGKEYIRKTELVYRSGGTEQTYLPYYRIYVEIPEMKTPGGLNTYGAYYVPAVKGEYISNLPLWDGSFN